MIELIQFPWSPFCLVQRRILDYAGAPYKITNIPSGDRSLIWKLTRQRYYGVPIIKDGNSVIFETSDNSQVIAKYLDEELELDLFPPVWRGVQAILWRYIENEIEGATFRLNDIYYQEFCSSGDQLPFLRHKERKFGRGCIEQWRAQQKTWLETLGQNLEPFEAMLATKPFLLDHQPRFVDFDLLGMLDNFLFSGHYKLPARHKNIRKWFDRLSALKFDHPHQ